MMAIRGWGSYLRDVLKVLAIHRNFPTRFDRHSITTLFAGSPSNRCCRSEALRADGSGSHRLKRIPTGAVESHAPGENSPCGARYLVGQCDHDDVVVSPLQQPFNPVRFSGSGNHGPGAGDQQGPQVGVSSLGDTQLLRLPPSAHVTRDQPYPCGELPRGFECAEVPDRRHQRLGCQVSDTRNLLNGLHLPVLSNHGAQPLANVVDVILQSIDAFELLLDADDQIGRQVTLFLGLGDFGLDHLEQLVVPHGHGNTELGQAASQGIGLHDAHLHHLTAHAVQCQTSLLALRFHGDRQDVRLLCRHPDRLCIHRVGLVTQQEGFDMLGLQQLDVMSQRLDRPGPVMR